MEFLDFLLRAKKATYAGCGPEATPSRPGSHDLHYTEDDMAYIDTYVGGQDFIGQEVIWKASRTVWGMNYYGRTQSFPPGFADFLKTALREPPPHAPYRGPARFEQGDFLYLCKWEGKVEQFKGYEEILYQGQPVYRLWFHGGLVND